LPIDVICGRRSVPVVRDLYVTDIGHFPTARDHYVDRPRGLSEAILIYCTDGAGSCALSDRTWDIKSGWALFIPPRVPHLYHAHPTAPWSIYWVHFAGTRVGAYLEVLGIACGNPVLYIPSDQVVIEAFEEVLSHSEHAYSDIDLLGQSTSLCHLLGILGCHQRAPGVRGRFTEEGILDSIHYMQDHLDGSVRSNDLAEVAHMSLSTYHHSFRKQMSTSPIHFFIRLKMQRACELLDTTDWSVREIARRLGYDDQFYFCRLFKKVIGKTPTDYRASVHGLFDA
jgi:AraC-like DNA-binding protein